MHFWVQQTSSTKSQGVNLIDFIGSLLCASAACHTSYVWLRGTSAFLHKDNVQRIYNVHMHVHTESLSSLGVFGWLLDASVNITGSRRLSALSYLVLVPLCSKLKLYPHPPHCVLPSAPGLSTVPEFVFADTFLAHTHAIFWNHDTLMETKPQLPGKMKGTSWTLKMILWPAVSTCNKLKGSVGTEHIK